MVIDDRFEPGRRPILAEPDAPTEPMSGAAVPLIRDDVVVGALTVLRNDVDRPFAPNEVEALPILAGLVALAITNTFLHMEVTELSVRDALTGLFNRRHLDAAIGRMEASRSRRAPADREAAAAIIFDLDHFGAINKRYGHHTGDQILRAFADVLRARFRGADLVARYGGEEFVAILERATPEQAAAIADEVRVAFADVPVPAPDGTPIRSTVSAGLRRDGRRRGPLRRHPGPRRRRARDGQAGGSQPGHRGLTGTSAGRARRRPDRPGHGRCRTAPRAVPGARRPLSERPPGRGMLPGPRPVRSHRPR